MANLKIFERAERLFLEMAGNGYLMGTFCQKCTPVLHRAKMQRYPTYSGNIKKYCPVLSGKQNASEVCKLNGKKVHDCRSATYEVTDKLGIPMTSLSSNNQ